MSPRIRLLLTLGLLIACVWASAQSAPTGAGGQAAKPEIKHVTATYTSPTSGKEMFNSYCASCHGVDGKGDGPAAPTLKMPATNLTMLSVKNGSTFPEAHVAAVLQGTAMTAAHGSKELPAWGPIFLTMGGNSAAQVQLRVRNLTNHLESIQVE